MAKLRLTRAAAQDLVEFREYGNERFGGDAADRYFLGLDAAFARLEAYPMAASAQPEWGQAIRCLTFRRHRILYELKNDEVLIVRMLHHARNVATALKS
ncbi:MAG: type II toxin-antitoxin system RelE/ParE family toxin [Sphingomonadaceae bacterium]